MPENYYQEYKEEKYYIREIELECGTNEGLIEVIPETIGQFIGLHDKNGKEIYEGDIAKKLVWNKKKYMETDNGECYSYAKIEYIEELAGFYLVNNEGKICWELAQDKYNIEICGNIYDNPKLLEGK